MDLKRAGNPNNTMINMATREEAEEDLRVAMLVLHVAKTNQYDKVISYLEENVRKAQATLAGFGRFSPSNLLGGFLELVAPRSPGGSVLPFTTKWKGTAPQLGQVYVDNV